jgi:hypothetical protein
MISAGITRAKIITTLPPRSDERRDVNMRRAFNALPIRLETFTMPIPKDADRPISAQFAIGRLREL